MKILVTGRTGQLARSLAEAAAAPDVQIVCAGRPDLDLTDERSVAGLIARERADVVVNAAAYTAVDKAETEPAMANAVNVLGAEYVARACAANSIPLIHISTDYVFDGAKDRPYREDDPTGPINAYGRSKLDAERCVVASCGQHLILRTEWLYSPFGENFVKTMLRLAEGRPSIGVVDEQLGSPTYAPHLAEIVLVIAARIVADPGRTRWGVYHAVGSGETTWYGFAREVFRLAAKYGLPAAEVLAIAAADYPTLARRPVNSRLDCEKLRLAFGLELPNWRAGVQDCMARLAAPAANRTP